MHICTVIVAFVYKCTTLHPLMWVFFWSKCVKCDIFSIMQDFASIDVDALIISFVLAKFQEDQKSIAMSSNKY